MIRSIREKLNIDGQENSAGAAATELKSADQVSERRERRSAAGRLRISITLLVLALLSVIATTVAWMSISDYGRVDSLNMEVTTGISMRFDLSQHSSFEEYVETLKFEDIRGNMKSQLGFDMNTAPLVPVTTSDCSTFTYEDGAVSKETSGEYLTFTLHFMAETDMVVHLTTETGDDQEGTLIETVNPDMKNAMRISFTTDGKSYVYDPGLGNTSTSSGNVKTFGLPEGSMSFNDSNAMFSLVEDQDKEVKVHVWVEGTDPNCSNSIKGSGYNITLKFEGTDEDNGPVESASSKDKKSKKHDSADRTAEEVEEDESFEKIKNLWNDLVNEY